MKANLSQTEPKILERWEKEQIYGRLRELRKNAPVFGMHDGPPYANGNIHLGTALNKILKDFIVKSKSMEGFNAPFVPGWDCHGLPIEIKVDQELGARKAHMQPAEIRQECRKYAAKYVELHRRDFKRLGVFGQWDAPYLTMSATYEAVIAGAFLEFLDKGYVYKGLKPVHWCIHCRTALAEAEVEYENHTSPSIWVKFALLTDPSQLSPALAGRKVSALIWTTTPWTLPANLALAFHPSFEYAAVETNSSPNAEVFLVARPLLEEVARKCGFAPGQVLATMEGSRLEKTRFQHPFLERESAGILGTHVTLEQGTGIVHTAPGHGQEDFEVGEKYKLETLSPVDARGRFVEGYGEISGKTVFEANPVVVDFLRNRGALVQAESVEHSYPHCWRCHHPVIFRATEQWFIKLDHQDLRSRALAEIRKVQWNPEWGMERIANMIATRPDWCISRQRIWGVPIIVFYCESCQQVFTERSALARVVEIFSTETSDVWYTKPPSELLPPGTRCGHCGGTQFRPERDILDVWFDSGSSHLAVLGKRPDLPWPADIYVEGSDQYRGWFHSSLLVAVGLRGRAPYRQVATHGWVLDEHGRAMSKSLGNVIEPQAIINSHGAEILRLWVASMDFRDDVRISKEMLTRLSDSYRKIRNTFRYCLANLYDFDPAKDSVPLGRMMEVDQWALYRMARLVELCRNSYQELGFHKVYHAIYNFCTVELSAFYLDIAKDRLYTAAPQSLSRRSAQTALYRIADALVRLVAPILCFTAEEVWGYLPERPPDLPSVHLATFPEAAELSGELTIVQLERLGNWDRLIAVRNEVLKVLETARKEKFIGNSLEAKVEISAEGEWARLLTEYSDLLPMVFLVSQVHLATDGLPGATEGATEGLIRGLRIAVRRADGQKCERCWNYSVRVGQEPDFPSLCERCVAALQAMQIPNPKP
ncbi:MAG: isoleucine--tRNA ligase [Acidobacteria bacterium RIFCSPLOWO2_12_FULL_60_22]|nr:MAG: isoleucine--tRNA ligase [Acidobacteria bacterium RIFCSPLOWO2_12_FULL_60_22]